MKMKAYTVEASMDAWKPEINLRNVLTMALKEVYDTVVIEVLINEISNLSLELELSELFAKVDEAVEALFTLVVEAAKTTRSQFIIINRIQRVDNHSRALLSIYADHATKKLHETAGRPRNIVLADLGVKARRGEDEVELFGFPGEYDSRPKSRGWVDGRHLMGIKGTKVFTDQAVKLIKELV